MRKPRPSARFARLNSKFFTYCPVTELFFNDERRSRFSPYILPLFVVRALFPARESALITSFIYVPLRKLGNSPSFRPRPRPRPRSYAHLCRRTCTLSSLSCRRRGTYQRINEN